MKNVLVGAGYLIGNNTPLVNIGYRGDLLSVLASYDFVYRKDMRPVGSFELHLSYNLRNKENRHPTSLLSFESW